MEMKSTVGIPAKNRIGYRSPAVLTEIAAPDYYATAESITFEVKETGEVQKVVMKDAPLQVEISKKTITGEEELPGAVLRVSDLEGKVL